MAHMPRRNDQPARRSAGAALERSLLGRRSGLAEAFLS
jgi:hypothetical protein